MTGRTSLPVAVTVSAFLCAVDVRETRSGSGESASWGGSQRTAVLGSHLVHVLLQRCPVEMQQGRMELARETSTHQGLLTDGGDHVEHLHVAGSRLGCGLFWQTLARCAPWLVGRPGFIVWIGSQQLGEVIPRRLRRGRGRNGVGLVLDPSARHLPDACQHSPPKTTHKTGNPEVLPAKC